ncbi:MAG TPA: hypothetical protein VGY91_11450, partial [Chthoniobacterales bacterium]|nr:hypothetical protein [Chthoniobacterales bacterium]
MKENQRSYHLAFVQVVGNNSPFCHGFQSASGAKNRSPNWIANGVAASFHVTSGFPPLQRGR